MTPFQRHRKKWLSCKKCVLHKTRKRVVLVRGKIPCEVLFIGEAPGTSEDSLGKPFVGPAGKLLDFIIERALDGQADYALTNLVACIPKEKGRKLEEPSEKCIKACIPRLNEFIKLCKPLSIVLVGKLAKKYQHLLVIPGKIQYTEIIHPAAILRMDVSQRGLAIQRSIATLEDVLIPF